MKKKTPSLQTKSITRIIEDMINSVDNSSFTILVLDNYTTQILSYYITMSELLNSGIFSVESLELKRQSFPNFNVIYFVKPTKESIDKIVNDFKDEKNPMYNEIHLFFPYRITYTVLNILVSNTLSFRIKTIKELNLSFFCNENIFSLRIKSCLNLFILNNSNSKDLYTKLNDIKNHLMTVFASMKEYPYIQYYNSSICNQLVDLLKNELNQLNELKLLNKERKSICLIVDRSIDMVAPILHDYSYKSLLYDFLKVDENDVILPIKNYPKLENCKLDENDDFWMKYKNCHVGEVLEVIKEETKIYLEEDKSKLSDKNLNDFNNLRKALENRSANQKKVKYLNNHLLICEILSTVSNII